MINTTFLKHPHKINVPKFLGGKNPSQLRCQKYRQYNVAYYEEVLIHYMAESRVAQNYRERFLNTSQQLNLVLEMYCRNDYISHFLNINLEDISHKQIVDLFRACIRNNSFKSAIHIYLRYMNSKDVDRRMIDVFISSMKNSTEFHELKIFFINQHFDMLTIMQMNDLVDMFIDCL